MKTFTSIALTLLLASTVIAAALGFDSAVQDHRFIQYIVDPKQHNIRLYWKNDQGEKFKNIGGLKSWMEGRNETLVFAMNAGMFTGDFSPLGLYVENGNWITPLDTSGGTGNFYLKPNGVFYVSDDNTAGVCTTEDFVPSTDIAFATQSGPMLLINGAIHPAFRKGSTNLNIRNGVGILPDNRVVFVISREKVNFYDFASYFSSLGCRNALYLDGAISKAYCPEHNWEQLDGKLGVIVGVTNRQ
ncbi:MAG: phosphodiester glycosidase family protein [Flavobacteriales bacterium]|nr:phosphodiester glycosidase family protein [Flavobacteriales bacterium]